jgi:phosphate uptake regulator
MAKIVQEHQLGIVAQDFKPETMAAALNKMTKESIDAFKLNADKAAKILNAEENMKRLHNEMERLLN